MKLTTAVLCSLSLVGCATAPKEVVVNAPSAASAPALSASSPTIVVLENRCATLALTARHIAEIRDANIPIDDVQLLISDPMEYPVAPMIREVYSRKDITPAAGATNSYTICMASGFNVMASALSNADAEFNATESQKLRDELAAKKAAKSKVKPIVKKAST